MRKNTAHASNNATAMAQETFWDEAFQSLDDERAPSGLSHQIMAAVEQEPVPVWRRVWRWVWAPRELVIRPALAAAALAAAVVLLGGVIYWGQPLLPGAGPLEGEQAVAERVPVTFVLPDNGDRIERVAVIGSFNDWNREGGTMRYDHKRQAWVTSMRVRPGRHEYVFLVNGSKRVPDPGSPFYRQDGFGEKNSVLLVTGASQRSASHVL
mgnify:FL=1